jgi:hypothetical protein
MVRSFSNRLRRTHWWNFTSSISIALPRDAECRKEWTGEREWWRWLCAVGGGRGTGDERRKREEEKVEKEGEDKGKYTEKERMRRERRERTPSGVFKHDLVVQPQPQLGHARKVALHLDGTEDLRSDDVSVSVDLCVRGISFNLSAKVERGKKGKRRTNKFTDSTTSKNTSFFLYRIPSLLQLTAFVTAIGGLTCTSSLCDSCVMYSWRILDSVVWG